MTEGRPAVGRGPLEDIRVIAVTDYGAGPFAAQMLAELGADVIKIENLGAGDSSRYVPPFQMGTHSLFFESVNRATRSVQVDLKHPDGHAVLRDLVSDSDALFSNLRGTVTRRLRLHHEDLRATNESLVCCFLTGWGSDGIRGGDPAYDYGVQAFTGHMALTGEPGQPPTRSSAPWVDFGSAMTAAFALLAGVHDARRTGEGQDVEVSMVDFAMSMWTYMGTWYLTGRLAPQRTRMSAHQSVVPSQVFPTADGHVVVMCQTDRFWQALCREMKLDDFLDDPRLTTHAGRRAHRAEVLSRLESRFREHGTEEWVSRLRDHVPIEPVHDIDQAFSSYADLRPGQLAAIEHPVLGEYRVVTAPVTTSKQRLHPRRAPFLGEHTSEVLRDVAGYPDTRIDELLRRGVVRQGDE